MGDIAFIVAVHSESTGLLRRFSQRQTSKGNGHTFHTGVFAKNRCVLTESGVGYKRAETAAKVLCDVFEPQVIVNAGCAGGLSDRLKKFALCIPQQIVRCADEETLQCLDITPVIPQNAPFDSSKLTLFTADEIVPTPQKKRNTAVQTGAELVDMEAFAVAEVCRTKNIPFICIKIVLDTVADTLPPDVLDLFNVSENGRSKIFLAGALGKMLLRRPAALADMWKLYNHAEQASEKLARQAEKELGYGKFRP